MEGTFGRGELGESSSLFEGVEEEGFGRVEGGSYGRAV